MTWDVLLGAWGALLANTASRIGPIAQPTRLYPLYDPHIQTFFQLRVWGLQDSLSNRKDSFRLPVPDDIGTIGYVLFNEAPSDDGFTRALTSAGVRLTEATTTDVVAAYSVHARIVAHLLDIHYAVAYFSARTATVYNRPLYCDWILEDDYFSPTIAPLVVIRDGELVRFYSDGLRSIGAPEIQLATPIKQLKSTRDVFNDLTFFISRVVLGERFAEGQVIRHLNPYTYTVKNAEWFASGERPAVELEIADAPARDPTHLNSAPGATTPIPSDTSALVLCKTQPDRNVAFGLLQDIGVTFELVNQGFTTIKRMPYYPVHFQGNIFFVSLGKADEQDLKDAMTAVTPTLFPGGDNILKTATSYLCVTHMPEFSETPPPATPEQERALCAVQSQIAAALLATPEAIGYYGKSIGKIALHEHDQHYFTTLCLFRRDAGIDRCYLAQLRSIAYLRKKGSIDVPLV